jgi:hypothetical protein
MIWGRATRTYGNGRQEVGVCAASTEPFGTGLGLGTPEGSAKAIRTNLLN